MIATHIEIILIVTGATTAMALAQFIAPACSVRPVELAFWRHATSDHG
jgi:hypothetical protein